MGACFSESPAEEPIRDDSSDDGRYGSLEEAPPSKANSPMRLSLMMPSPDSSYRGDNYTNTDVSTRPRSATIDTDCTDVCRPLQPEHHAAAASHLVGSSSLDDLREREAETSPKDITLTLDNEEQGEGEGEHDDNSVEGMAMQGMFGDPEEGLVEDATVIKYDEYERVVKGEKADTLKLALVQKHHSLWGEFIYNAARVLADLMDAGTLDVKGKTVVELGAGAGLPAIIAALNGASSVTITDYGRNNDIGLVEAIGINIENLKKDRPHLPCVLEGHLHGYPYVWGDRVDSILECNNRNKFDIVIMADCIFNRSVHAQLVESMVLLMEPGGCCYCSFSHHDPQKTELDLVFLTMVEEAGYCVEHIYKEQRRSYPFFEKDGMDEDRGWVYVVRISSSSSSIPLRPQKS